MNAVQKRKVEEGKHQARKWFLTINNPEDKGTTIDNVEERLKTLKSVQGGFIAGETGKEGIYHLHAYVCCSSPIRFSTLRKHFNEAHIEIAKGSNQQIRDYIFKEGSENHRHFGDIPNERPGARMSASEQLRDMVAQGMSDNEIVMEKASNMHHLTTIERYRQILRKEEYGKKCRNVEVMYIEGATGVGKTQWVYDHYGFDDVYMIDDYGPNSYDEYEGEGVLVLDEFEGQIDTSYLRKLLDKFPLRLKSRYKNKYACFTKIIIISNTPLKLQYRDIQSVDPESWKAILRRINKVRVYTAYLEHEDYTVEEYFAKFDKQVNHRPFGIIQRSIQKKTIPLRSPQPKEELPLRKKKLRAKKAN